MKDNLVDPTRDRALLIGIDAYDGGASLEGCVNDIDAIQRILLERLGIAANRIKRLASPLYGTTHDETIPEQEATLENIRKELRRLSGAKVDAEEPLDIQEGDRIFIYYAGHGTQLAVTGSNGGTFFREALVPRDFVVDIVTRQYLPDWEVNGFLSAIVAKTSSVTFILDCCCSAGATRDLPGKNKSRSRFLELDASTKPQLDSAPSSPVGQRGLMSGLAGSVARCQVVAACLDDERAQETMDQNGLAHGVLSMVLAKHLNALPKEAIGDLRWGQIWPAILAGVSAKNSAQHPWISGGYARSVFGGPPDDADTGFSVTREGDTFVLQAGTLFGVSVGAELAIYGRTPPKFPALGSAADRALRAPRIRVTSATRSTASAVALDSIAELPVGARARLVKTGAPDRLRVAFVPEVPEIANTLRQSGLVEVVEACDPSDMALVQRSDNTWALTDDVFGTGEVSGEPMLATIPPESMADVVAIVNHYHVYSLPLRLAKNCQDLPRKLRISLHDARDAARLSDKEAQDLDQFPELAAGKTAPYVLRAGETEYESVPICFGVRNDSDSTLKVALIGCNNSGRVVSLGEKVIGRGAHVFWFGETIKQPFPVTRLPRRSSCVDRVVAIGTTNRSVSFQFLLQSTSFEELVGAHQRGNREIGVQPASTPAELWTSAVTALRVEAR